MEVTDTPADAASRWCVRAARIEETETLAALAAQAPARGWSAASFAAELARPGGWAWALRERAGPATPQGLLLARPVLDELHVLLVIVAPALRRRGGGSALLRVALERARQRAVAVVHLDVRASNGPALALYRRHGFLAVGRRPRYYEGREDAVLMSLRLVEGSCP
ncbi:GNAT family N-acetyltransferase [Myxococcota bacterium]|nr:GNAT family N-acetyltransferase [Myxococcota bacterium]MCZ7618650.1 GNAT family N-acetyltransferase [Myxococcota bacterium]